MQPQKLVRVRRKKNRDLIKVSKFQNELMKSSFLPKFERESVRIPALQGRNSDNFSFVFWEKQ